MKDLELTEREKEAFLLLMVYWVCCRLARIISEGQCPAEGGNTNV